MKQLIILCILPINFHLSQWVLFFSSEKKYFPLYLIWVCSLIQQSEQMLNSPSWEKNRFVLLIRYQWCCILPNFLHMRIQCRRVHQQILCSQPRRESSSIFKAYINHIISLKNIENKEAKISDLCPWEWVQFKCGWIPTGIVKIKWQWTYKKVWNQSNLWLMREYMKNLPIISWPNDTERSIHFFPPQMP